MNIGSEFSTVFRIGTLSLAIAGMVLSTALAQTPYPAPVQTYPAPTQQYPAPTQPYPTPGQTYPSPGQNYPVPGQPYPTSGTSMYPQSNQPYAGYPGSQPAPQGHFFRDLFAQTIAAVLQTSTGGLLSLISGRIMDWFAHRTTSAQAPNPYANNQYPQYPTAAYANNQYAQNPAAGYANSQYPQSPTSAYTSPNSYPSAYPSNPSQQSAYGPTATQPSPYTTPGQSYPSPATPGYATPPAAYPNASAGQVGATDPFAVNSPGNNGYGTTAGYGGATAQVYDSRTGQLVTGTANPYATRAVGTENALYAGIAYEVHAIAADGQTTPVNTATYAFHTGDKFMVYYRPSLPGHMEVYNVNASGQKTLIDSSNMAAGQMVGLGPYQFANQAGDETLQMVLSPCTNPQLLAATRDIVKVDASSNGSAAGGLRLGNCGAPTARGVDVTTRDIQKVAVEGTTSFALDPLSGQEVSSGQVIPRQAIIVFHHL
jgi:hypothetical protein